MRVRVSQCVCMRVCVSALLTGSSHNVCSSIVLDETFDDPYATKMCKCVFVCVHAFPSIWWVCPCLRKWESTYQSTILGNNGRKAC